MEWRVGTSGFSYKEWIGPFYPEKTKPAEMLAHYAAHLPAVEVNNTFYRMPKPQVLEGWAAEVPAGFRFAVKASRRITHIRRLKDAGEETRYLLEVVAALGDALGLLLFQLHPNQKAEPDRLRAFLDHLPEGTRAAFEFRHPSWADAAIVDALRERSMALCFVDGDEEGSEEPADPAAETGAAEIPFAPTADYGYLRLRRARYDDAALAAFAARCVDAGWRETFVFFKHEDDGEGPRLARRFLDHAPA